MSAALAAEMDMTAAKPAAMARLKGFTSASPVSSASTD
jgi:hypothetical protein